MPFRLLCFRALLPFVILAGAFLATAGTDDVTAQEAACVTKNRSIPGATGKCAVQICTWQECVDKIMLGQYGGLKLDNKEAFKSQSERDSALATCKPHEQIMNQCMQAAAPKAWCRTGRDRDKPRIEEKGLALKTQFDKLAAEYKPRRTAHNAKVANWNTQWREIKAIAAAYSADKRTMSKDAVYAKWEASGRRASAAAKKKALEAQRPGISAESAALKDMKTRLDSYRGTLKPLQEAWDARDCARALAVLGLN